MSTTLWLKRKARLRALLKTTEDEEEAGLALDRILHGQNVIGKTAKTAEIDAIRFQDTDLQVIGTLERGQFGLIDVVKCHLDGQLYVRKSIEKRFALRTRDQCFPQFERDILLKARTTESVWAPHLLCAFQTPTHLSLVMQYAEGGTLWDVLESSPLNGRVSDDDMKWWMPQVISAVHWCHSQGFAHRDIKPHNFVLGRGAHVLLIDFGSAAPLENGRLPKKYCLVPCGTCDYISPEILNAHEEALVALEMDDVCGPEEPYGYGFETDWWSVGAMLYEMVYGVAPFFATDIRKTYIRIIQHEKSLRFDASVPVSAALQDLLRRFLTDADRRFGHRGISEILDHPVFLGRPPPGLHLPQFTYAEPSVALQPVEEESHSQPFAFSALFQSSDVTSPGLSVHPTPLRAARCPRPRTSLASIHDRHSPSRAPFVLHTTPNPHLLPHPVTPAFHSYPFLTPNRPSSGATHQTLPRASTVRRTAGRRPVSDREAMKQLVDCVGLSARKKVLESGRKPRVLPSFTSQKTLRFLPPAVAVPDFASSSQGRLRPTIVVPGASSGEGETETESEGPPSPSPTPRPGSAMSMMSRRSGTPTITGTYSQRSGVLLGMGSSSVSLSLPRAGRSVEASAEGYGAVTTPTFEDTTFDELEDKHASMMEEILMLEDRLDQFSLLVGRRR
ncbi:kinase-like domain-containing protein [Mycena sp. CBHHK59/15]|nr:kinase-like domain-containing protein [Mycena sp. CBHHK59/15]